MPTPKASECDPLRPDLAPAQVLELALLRLPDKRWGEVFGADLDPRELEARAVERDPGAAAWLKERARVRAKQRGGG